jgi:hypothetical protein
MQRNRSMHTRSCLLIPLMKSATTSYLSALLIYQSPSQSQLHESVWINLFLMTLNSLFLTPGGNGAHDGNTFTGAAFGIESSIASNHSLSSVQREILSLFLQYTHNTEGGDISDVIYALRGTATAEQIR